jgi:hypothetical protein
MGFYTTDTEAGDTGSGDTFAVLNEPKGGSFGMLCILLAFGGGAEQKTGIYYHSRVAGIFKLQ